MEMTPEVARELLEYDPTTGLVTWKPRSRPWFKDDLSWKMWNTRYAGKSAGHSSVSGYVIVTIFYHRYRAHRLIWLMTTGEWPDQVDHLNHDRSDNRWSNLRDVNNQENGRNQSHSRANTSGVTGISWKKHGQKWQARIHLDGRSKFLGNFVNKEDAIAARRAAEICSGYNPLHGKHQAGEVSQ